MPWLRCVVTIEKELGQKLAPGYCDDRSDHALLSNVEDFGVGKRSDLYVRLMGHPRRSLEDSSAESSVVCGGPDEEVSEGTTLATD